MVCGGIACRRHVLSDPGVVAGWVSVVGDSSCSYLPLMVSFMCWCGAVGRVAPMVAEVFWVWCVGVVPGGGCGLRGGSRSSFVLAGTRRSGGRRLVAVVFA